MPIFRGRLARRRAEPLPASSRRPEPQFLVPVRLALAGAYRLEGQPDPAAREAELTDDTTVLGCGRQATGSKLPGSAGRGANAGNGAGKLGNRSRSGTQPSRRTVALELI